MKPGSIAKFVGLKNDDLNGVFVQILTNKVTNTVPEFDGKYREAERYGIRLIGSGASGYARPENLEQVFGTS